jgi:hypothetical protein
MLPLEDVLQLIHLYAERGSPKHEKAAMRWPERYRSRASQALSPTCEGHRVAQVHGRIEPERIDRVEAPSGVVLRDIEGVRTAPLIPVSQVLSVVVENDDARAARVCGRGAAGARDGEGPGPEIARSPGA